jgi:hypothetical protein
LLLGWFVSLEIECELGSIAAGDVNWEIMIEVVFVFVVFLAQHALLLRL